MEEKEEFRVIDEFSPKSDLQHDLRPHQIDTSRGQVGKFGKCEVEVAACSLVKYFQMADRWHSFTLEEYINFLKILPLRHNESNALFGLICAWFDDGGAAGCYRKTGDTYIVMNGDGTLCVTDKFIDRCRL